jgi:O-antigen ligase
LKLGRSEQWWILLIVMTPVGFLSVFNWSGVLLLALVILACWTWLQATGAPSPHRPASRWHIAVFLSPIFAVGAAQLLRWELNLPDFDAPLRLLLATAVYLALWRIRFPAAVLMSALIIGIALGVPAAWLGMTPEAIAGWGGRFATPLSDTNAFGSFMGLFVCMLSAAHFLRPSIKQRWLEVLITLVFLVTIGLGLYLLFGTYGRGAWLATALGLLVVGGVVAHARPERAGRRAFWLLLSLFLVPGLMSQLAPDTFTNLLARAQSIVSEVALWHQGVERDSSGGMRLEMNAAALDLFLHAPLTGYGDVGYAQAAREPWMTAKYSEALIHMFTTAGAHNELWARTLSSGIWGFMATALFFVVPLATFLHVLRNHSKGLHVVGGIGLVAISYLFFIQFTNEFSLKYIASFNAYLMAVLLAAAANSLQDDKQTETL